MTSLFGVRDHTDAVELLATTEDATALRLRYWYGGSISDFLSTNPDAVLGQITANCNFNLIPTQRDAWIAQIEFLRSQRVSLC
jgi:hypothetical protein